MGHAPLQDIEEGVPVVALNLLTCTVKPKYGEKKLKNCFELISLKSQFQFVADSPNEMMVRPPHPTHHAVVMSADTRTRPRTRCTRIG